MDEGSGVEQVVQWCHFQSLFSAGVAGLRVSARLPLCGFDKRQQRRHPAASPEVPTVVHLM